MKQPDLFDIPQTDQRLPAALAAVDCADPAGAIWQAMRQRGCEFGVCGNAEAVMVHGFGVNGYGPSRSAAAKAWVDAARSKLDGKA